MLSAAVRRSAEIRVIREATSKLVDRLCSNPTRRERASIKVARYLLINYPTLIAHGRLYATCTKSIGAGVYEVFMEPTNP